MRPVPADASDRSPGDRVAVCAKVPFRAETIPAAALAELLGVTVRTIADLAKRNAVAVRAAPSAPVGA